MDLKELYQTLESARSRLKLSQAEVGRLAFGSASSSPLQNIKRGNVPSVEKLQALAEVLDLELYFGEKRDEKAAFSDRELPVRGYAKCSPQGWAGDETVLGQLAAPTWLDDDDAFWVQAIGQSMLPEGIRQGDHCLVSPASSVTIGARVYLKEHPTGAASIKRVTEIRDDALVLRGWLPVLNGRQEEFVETKFNIGLSECFPIIADYRGRPGQSDARFIPDPRNELEPGPRLLPIDLHKPPEPPPGFVVPDRIGALGDWLRQLNTSYAAVVMVVCPDDGVAAKIPQGSIVLVNMVLQEFVGPGVYLVDLPGGERAFRHIDEVRGGGYLMRTDDGHPPEVITGADVRRGILKGKAIWYGAEVF